MLQEEVYNMNILKAFRAQALYGHWRMLSTRERQKCRSAAHPEHSRGQESRHAANHTRAGGERSRRVLRRQDDARIASARQQNYRQRSEGWWGLLYTSFSEAVYKFISAHRSKKSELWAISHCQSQRCQSVRSNCSRWNLSWAAEIASRFEFTKG